MRCSTTKALPAALGRGSVVIARAVSLRAAEETARKAAAVREQLKNAHSRQGRQIHEHNVLIAELQQQAARRSHKAAQQQQQGPSVGQTHAAEREQQQQQQELQAQLNRPDGDNQSSVDASLDAPQQPRRMWRQRQQQHVHLHQQQQQQQFPQHQDPSSSRRQQQRALHSPDFYEVLQGVEVLARSDKVTDWQHASWQCRQVLVPAVCSPQQAAAAWRVINSLAGKGLSKYHSRQLGSAVAELAKVSLSNQDSSVLQRLLASGSRFSLGPRQLRDLVAVAAAAGADSFMLNGLLELAPSCQLSNRAFFAAVCSSLNRRHYQEAQAALQLLQDMGLPLSPGLQRLQQQVAAGLRGGAGR